jgi:hypothetical protein
MACLTGWDVPDERGGMEECVCGVLVGFIFWDEEVGRGGEWDVTRSTWRRQVLLRGKVWKVVAGLLEELGVEKDCLRVRGL